MNTIMHCLSYKDDLNVANLGQDPYLAIHDTRKEVKSLKYNLSKVMPEEGCNNTERLLYDIWTEFDIF